MFPPPLGTPKSKLETPFLALDLDAMERNRDAMSAFLAERNLAWRPHVKSHRSPPLARTLLDHGAIGVTCATLEEAEQMIAGGISTPLLANLVVDREKLARLARLAIEASPIATCDHYVQAEALSAACKEAGATCDVLVDVDIGMNRVGVRPGADAAQLARAVDGLPALELVGIMGYEGHLLTVADQTEKRRRIEEAIGTLLHTRDRLVRDGLRCDIVSAGGTGSYQITAGIEGVTEVQAGGGIFGDLFATNVCRVEGLEPALTTPATVVSRPSLNRAVVDAGRKTTNGELHMPAVKGFPDAEVTRLSAEHGVLSLGEGGSRDLRIGDRVELVVGYSDFTCVLHTHLLGFRGDALEAVFPIGGRFRALDP